MNSKKIKLAVSLLAPALLLAGCGGGISGGDDWRFSYDEVTYDPIYGSTTNDEAYDYDNLIVNPISNELREDFAFGVDASMVYQVEQCGGKYYNKEGREQDVFQILADNGVNFFRVRLWNNPSGSRGRTFGGGNNNLENDIAMMKRARAAGMNVCLDFHYSDFWADPDKQQLPTDWRQLSKEQIPETLATFTTDSLQKCLDEGIDIAAVQIGNEINNGMCGDYGAIDWSDLDGSFAYISSLLTAGINAAKSIYPNVKSIIHLANGTNGDEFETFFTYLDNNNVPYDIIGASYYPALAGDLTRLQANLDNVTAVTGKPAMIVETSWGFTNDFNEWTGNTYSADDEDAGGYLTSIQAQATSLRDVLDVISKVPSQRGIGCFYWEPGWLPVEGADWATNYGQSYADYGDISHASSYPEHGLATWSNQGWFSYTGKALPSIQVYNMVKEGGANPTTETSISARVSEYEATINLAASETLPSTGKVVTNLDAIRDATVVWNEAEASACTEVGVYTVSGVLDSKYNVTLTATCIENFIVDPGFENQGETDIVKEPWVIRSQSPADTKVVKLDRKSDVRTGRTDLNWYYSAGDFSFDVYQKISNVEAGTYTLTTYILAPSQDDFAQTLTLYITINGVENSLDISNLCVGWSSWYQKAEITNITIAEGDEVEVGLKGNVTARGWGHNDDWSLVKA